MRGRRGRRHGGWLEMRRGDDHGRRPTSEFHRRSIAGPGGVLGGAGQARRLAAGRSSKVLDYSQPPFAHWFVGGETNLCHNAVDRHLAARGDQKALVWISTEVGQEATYTYRELHAEVNRCAADDAVARRAARRSRAHLHADDSRGGVRDARVRADRRDPFGGVRRLRCARASRRASTTRSPGSWSPPTPACAQGKVVQYKPLLDEAIRLAEASAAEGAAREPRARSEHANRVAGRDVDWTRSARKHIGRGGSGAPGSNRASPPTSCTPPARPASRKACSATSAAMRWRSPPR